MNMEGLKITIVTFCWPPRNAIGTHRPYSWAKYWSQMGAKVTVLTAYKYEYDQPLDLDLPLLPNVDVIEVKYSSASSSLANISRSLPFWGAAKSIFQKIRRHSSLVKHPREAWVESALKYTPSLAINSDVVVSTYDPKGAHIIASEIIRQNPKLLWAADYRDPWSSSQRSGWSVKALQAERMQELNSVGKYAHFISSVSDPLVAEISGLVGKPGVTITNGFDVQESVLNENLNNGKKINVTGQLNIVYTGRIYPGHRDPQPVLDVVHELERQSVIAPGSIKIHIYGEQVEALKKIAGDKKFMHILQLHGHVSREHALRSQENADILLLLESSSPGSEGVLTGKLFEYIASGNPILSVGSLRDSAISKLLIETGTGICVESDQRMISDILIDALQAKRQDWFYPKVDKIMKYSRQAQAEKLMAEILRHYSTRHSQ